MKQQDPRSINADVATMAKTIITPSNVTSFMMQGWEAFCTLYAFPLLMLLRPQYGTQHIHPFNQIIALLSMNFLAVVGYIFTGYHPSYHGLIGLPILVVIFWLVFIYHAQRHRRLMLNTDLEKDSEWEGPAWGFFERLPKGHSWAMVSMVYHPLFVIIGAGVLTALRVFHPFVFVYLFSMAVAMALRAVVEWYLAWCFIREKLDQQNRMPILQGIIEGKPLPQTLGASVLSAIPVTASPRERGAIVAKLAGLESQFAAMLSKVEPATAGAD